MYKFKNQSESTLTEFNPEKRLVSGYLSAFGVVDSDGDMLMPNAFKKTLSENGPQSNRPRIQYLSQHRYDKILGKFTVLEEDSKGLRFEGEVAKTPLGDESLALMQLGALKEHSIGFVTLDEEYNEAGRYNEIREVKLYEGSAVTWGANEYTPITEIKSEDKTAFVEKLNNRFEVLIKVLRKGSSVITDDTFRNFEIELEQIKSSYNSLLETLPSNHKGNKEPKEEDMLIKSIYEHLNK